MKHPVLTYLTLLALTLLVAACAEEECTNLDDPVLNVEFRTFQLNSFGVPRERADTLVIFNLYGVGRPSTDTLAAGDRTSVLLPLSHVNNQSAFRMVYRLREEPAATRREATLTVRYRRESFFVSDVCGFNVRFRDLEADRLPADPALDSIRVINNAISETNTNAVNIRMYFKSN